MFCSSRVLPKGVRAMALILGAVGAMSISALLTAGGALAKVPMESGAQVPTPGSLTLLDVSSYYCVPCRVMKPRIENLSRRYDDTGRAKVFMIEMDDDPGVIDRFHVDVTPTLILFDRHGRELMRHRGLMDEEQLARALDAAIERP